jgi:hypothetical protein
MRRGAKLKARSDREFFKDQIVMEKRVRGNENLKFKGVPNSPYKAVKHKRSNQHHFIRGLKP